MTEKDWTPERCHRPVEGSKCRCSLDEGHDDDDRCVPANNHAWDLLAKASKNLADSENTLIHRDQELCAERNKLAEEKSRADDQLNDILSLTHKLSELEEELAKKDRHLAIIRAEYADLKAHYDQLQATMRIEKLAEVERERDELRNWKDNEAFPEIRDQLARVMSHSREIEQKYEDSNKTLQRIRSLLFLGEEDSIEERIVEIVNELNTVRKECIEADFELRKIQEQYVAHKLSRMYTVQLDEESSKILHDNLFELYVTEED